MRHGTRDPIHHLYARTLALLAAAVLVPAVTLADPTGRKEPEIKTATVSVADLDLNTEAGARIAHERISAAAWKLCGRLENSRKVDHRETTNECYRDAVAAASARLMPPAQVAGTNAPPKESDDSKR